MFASNTSAANGAATYIEDVFSTWLYTGTGASQTHSNGIDLAGKGGLVWLKKRSAVENHYLQDSSSSFANSLSSNTTAATIVGSGVVTSVSSTGFTTSSVSSGTTYASWTFRKQPKFFDVVTYTGDGTVGRNIPHNLMSVPGCVIVKRTSSSEGWYVSHRGVNSGFNVGYLNLTNAFTNGVNTAIPVGYATETTFRVSNTTGQTYANQSGETYVAYLFAHDAGGFGLTGTDNVISCGSYTGNGSAAGPSINLGYEPQWVLIKNASAASSVGWFMTDNLRGCETNGTDRYLAANLSQAETDTAYIDFTATGFNINSTFADVNGSGNTMIYIAIRRGPMRTPTSGTSVFAPVAYTATNVDNRLVNTGIITDMTMARVRTALSTGGFYTADRLRGNPFLGTAVTNAEDNSDTDSFMTPTAGYGNSFSAMNGFGVGNDSVRQLNYLTADELAYAFRRAPGFFDVVCRNGTGANATQAHNLAASPELVITKKRSAINEWYVTHSFTASGYQRQYLEQTAAASSHLYTDNFVWTARPTTSSLFFGSNSNVNQSGQTFVDYLFATCPGVSKVGSYTGTGTTQQINCGFTGGARFVLIKRTDSTGSWYFWDSARGIVAGNDPYLLLNSTASEVTTTDYIDTFSSGFEISSTAPAEINASGGTFIFLAIA